MTHVAKTPDRLNADVERYLHAAARDSAPSPIAADPLSGGASPIEQLVRVLGMAANAGDPADNERSAEDYARRETMTREAAEWFAAQDADAAAEMTAIGEQDPATSAAQQLPQMAAGAAAAVSAALGGALQALGQIPQQFAQVAQQAAQLFGRDATFAGAATSDEMIDTGLEDPLPVGDLGDGEDVLGAPDFGPAGFGAVPGSAPAWGFGQPAPAVPLGPPPAPSAATAPAAAPAGPAGAPASGQTHSAGVPVSGVPMIPPGAPVGAAGADRDATTATRRVAVPAVRNGAAVQGRIGVERAEPGAVTRIETTPVTTRRTHIAD